MIRILRSLFRRPAPLREPTPPFYGRCIWLDDDRIIARISLPTPPWWEEVSDEERPEFQRRFDEFYLAHPDLVEFQPRGPGTKEYDELQQRLREAAKAERVL